MSSKSQLNELTDETQDHSFQIHSEAELLNVFRDKDQRRVLTPAGISYPIRVQHYMSWREPSGVYVYLVFKQPEWKAPVGIVFKRPTSGNPVSNLRLCDWCLSYGPSDQVGMLGVTINSRQSVGIMLCLDLHCAGRLEEAAELSGKSFDKLIHQLYEKIGRFYARFLNDPNQRGTQDELN